MSGLDPATITSSSVFYAFPAEIMSMILKGVLDLDKLAKEWPDYVLNLEIWYVLRS